MTDRPMTAAAAALTDTDPELMAKYVQSTLAVCAFTDFLARGPVDELPDAELADTNRSVAEWRDRHAELYAEMKKRGIL